MVLLFTFVYLLAGNTIISLLTNVHEVIDTASGYAFWTYVLPLAGAAAFVWDGIFIGITASRQMLLSSLVATVLF